MNEVERDQNILQDEKENIKKNEETTGKRVIDFSLKYFLMDSFFHRDLKRLRIFGTLTS